MNSNTLNLNQSLIDAIIQGDRPRVTKLLSDGADVNTKDNNGQTALIIATYKGEIGLVHLLLEKGADTKITDPEGWTASKYAKRLDEMEILELLENTDQFRIQPAGIPPELKTFTPTARTTIQDELIDETVTARDWRDAVSLGSLIGGLIMIIIALLVKPQFLKSSITEVSNSVNSTVTNSTAANSSSSSPTVRDSSSSITESQAVDLISTWLEAKKRIFAPPFDRQLAADLTTDSRYERIVRRDGSIDWLKNNNAFYEYGFQKAEATGSFFSNQDQATIDVIVTEELTLYINGIIDESKSSFNTNRYRYNFRKENGKWKISNYDKVE
ncbi:MAG: DUF4101 domain-containing protein [Roseofilum sp. SBFL]|uniref:IMS domain-containing protein n=1 Tax=unclassified Roseofilum TaxID=2620099 RepID=UPI001B1AE556|nr:MULTISPECIES: IMS domain-containing protein [unclassified Roseofilum]MBP0013393.1 DUF4101 domain-containing protein [Roseofilum sp. SID3]MBP0024099.1 DUF4101 domain-containing protein [Roseofilum sp. SID2]MBP0038859.1 DUF4101 domain-containing protein [Roseofilum sp. SID1]MBP0041564.1 DUF4101 domain-containing protein [Roseofilum sp. SBFL]